VHVGVHERLSLSNKQTIQLLIDIQSKHCDIILIPTYYTKLLIYYYVSIQGFSSMLRSSPMFVNVVFNSLVEYQDSQPILDLSVKEFLWGYDDKLVKMASSVLPTWINFSKFGLLDRVIIIIDYNRYVPTYTVYILPQYTILSFNKCIMNKVWFYHCVASSLTFFICHSCFFLLA